MQALAFFVHVVGITTSSFSKPRTEDSGEKVEGLVIGKDSSQQKHTEMLPQQINIIQPHPLFNI